MPNPRSVRSSQRSVLACTNCSRRKIKCSKTIPCTACVRQNKAAQCQREPVAVVSRRSVGRSRASTALDDPPVPVTEAASLATVSPTLIDEVPTSTTVDPAAGSIATSSDVPLPQVDERMIEQLLASLSTPDTRLTNEAAAMLEFLTHGRRNILNQFIGTKSISTTIMPAVQKWDTFLPVQDARSLLVRHEKHLTWMHNTVHMPTFLREFDENIYKIECDRNWIALYYALLSQTLYHVDNDFLYSLPQPITVAHNFDKSDLICVLVSTAIRIAQCLNLHRLGLDERNASVNDAVDGEIRKRVWWFLVRSNCRVFATGDMRFLRYQPSINSGIITNPMQLSCVTIAERSIEAFQRWPDCLEARICRRMWTTLSYMISCSITILFALLFKNQNALTHDWERLRAYVEFGKDFLGKEAQRSSIARRGVRLLGALTELERTSGFSSDIEADIGDTIRRVALADDDGVEANTGEGYQMVFPYGQDLWESLMRDPAEGELI
ncbi:hypothetical protein FMUND_2599 [Fusarium mundagurra]|uniref:Zn(2)-C6 fungal-type domain-containing protein n=1 Tax=Fusarium mundagurra TaxID=1567541 RepID=A0A8H5Z248_9HYPO|nr:hypothetical protein FMUND_2599 [Fusarium mundagurra]